MFGNKKQEKVKLDEWDFDDELDFGDDLQDPFTPSKDRSPIVDVAKGALDGVKDSLKSPTYYGRIMRTALPEGYSAAYDTVDDIMGRAQGLYNEVSSELRPAVRSIKRTLNIAKKAVDGVLPDRVSKKLDEWLADKEIDQAKQQIDAQETRIATDLAEIFKVQAQARQEEKAEEMVDKVVASDRNQALMTQLNDVRSYLSRMVGYQDSINVAYQKKSLELRYRMFFLTSQLVEVAKATSTDSIGLLRSIQKNTALPEYQKITQSEKFSEMTRERLFGAVQQGMMDSGPGRFVQRIFDNLGGKLKEAGSRFRDGAEQGLQMAEQMQMAGDMAGGFEDMGMSKERMGGQLAAGFGMEELGQWFGRKLKPILEKNDKVVGLGHAGMYGARNFHEIARDWADENNMSGGLKGFAADVFNEALAERKNLTIGGDSILKAADPAIWDNLSRKSLVEIIPGYLSRMLQSINLLRDAGAERETFDYATNQFMSVDTLAKRVDSEVKSGYRYDSMVRQTDEIVKKIDPDGTLSEQERKDLQLALIKNAKAGKGFTPSTFAEPEKLKRLGLKSETATKVVDLIEGKLKRNDEGSLVITDPNTMRFLSEMAEQVGSLKASMPNAVEMANLYANTGNREALRRSGLVKGTGTDTEFFDEDFIIEAFRQKLNGVKVDETTPVETPISRSGFTPYTPAGSSTMATGGTAVLDPDQFGEIHNTLKEMLAIQKEATQVSSDATRSEAFMNQKIEQVMTEMRQQSTVKQADESVLLLQEIRQAIIDLNESMLNNVVGTEDTEKSSIKRHYKKLGSRLKKAGGLLLKPFKMADNLGKKLHGGVMGGIKTAFTKTGAVLGGAWDAINNKIPSDVFIFGDQLTPKLREAEMRAGRYVDVLTGKTITSIADITGPVRDKISGETLITLEEFKKGLYDHKGRKIVKGLVGWGRDKVAKLTGYISDNLGKGFKLPFTLASKVFRFSTKFLTEIPDVYVPGEKEPRLLSSILLRGGYFSSVTGKRIYSLKDIDGAVLDAEGKTRLTLEEIHKGVVDKDGNPIQSMMDKIKGLLKKGIGIGTGMVGWVGRNLKAGFKDVGKLASKLNPLNWKFPETFSFSQDRVVASIDRVYALLVKYFVMNGMDPKDAEAVAAEVSTKAKATLGTAGDIVRDGANTTAGKIKDAKDDLTKKVTDLAEKAKAKAEEASEKGKSKFQEIRDRTKAQREEVVEKLKRKRENMEGREGSWLNIMKKRREAKVAEKAQKTEGKDDKDKKGFFSKILSGLGLVASVLGSGFGMIKGMFGTLFGSMAKWWAIKKGAGALGTAAGGYAAGKAGAAAGGAAAGGAAKKGLLRRAVGGAARLGWGLTKGVAKAVGWTATRAVPWVARGALAIASAPVAIAAGVLTVGYYTVKYFRNRLKPMQKVRYTQYGLPPNERDYWFPVAELENELKDRVVFNSDGTADFKGKMDWQKYLGFFKVDPSDTQMVQRWSQWFNVRFKPIFLTHMKLLKDLDPKVNIMEVDEQLHDALKVDLAKKSLFKRSDAVYPYFDMATPYPDKSIVTGTNGIIKAINEVIKKFGKVKRPTMVDQTEKTDNKPEAVKDETKAVVKTEAPAETVRANVSTPKLQSAAATPDVVVPTGRPRTANDVVRDMQAAKQAKLSIEEMVRKGARYVGFDEERLLELGRSISGLKPGPKGLFHFSNEQYRQWAREEYELLGIDRRDQIKNTELEARLAANYFKSHERIYESITKEFPSVKQLLLSKHLGSVNRALSVASAPHEDPISRYITKTAGIDDLQKVMRDENGAARTVGSYLAYIDSLIESRIDMATPKYRFEQPVETAQPAAQTDTKPKVNNASPRVSIAQSMVAQTEGADKQRERAAKEAMIAQQDYSRETNVSLTNATDILRNSLDIQRSMDGSMRQAVTHLAKLVALNTLGSMGSNLSEEERERKLLEKFEELQAEQADAEAQGRGFFPFLNMRRKTS